MVTRKTKKQTINEHTPIDEDDKMEVSEVEKVRKGKTTRKLNSCSNKNDENKNKLIMKIIINIINRKKTTTPREQKCSPGCLRKR